MQSRKVHLVGSVPLEDNVAVFTAAAELMPGRVSRFPDGEVGRRWIMEQERVARACEQLVPAASASYTPGPTYQHYRLRPGLAFEDVRFGGLGYLEPAVDSYAQFTRLRRAGVLPGDARFLVTFPTPAAFLWCYVVPEERAAVEPAYLRALEREVAQVVEHIPAQDLAIQWDTVHEILMIEGARDSRLTPDEHIARLVHVGNLVPPEVELGYHFCYGYAARTHTVEPRDTGLLVDIANALFRSLRRPVQFLHMPVPRDRDDDAFFEPLRRLELAPPTELYLGLVHVTDGVEGARRRIAGASRHVPAFGVATECGLGQRPPDTIRPLLRLHDEVAQLP